MSPSSAQRESNIAGSNWSLWELTVEKTDGWGRNPQTLKTIIKKNADNHARANLPFYVCIGRVLA